jgi:predicted DNA-binding transcriptional regulator YafY
LWRAERLFRIIQVLRRETRPVRAADLAAELEVSPRTVYRDIAELQAQRVPVEGAAGVGYVLGRGYDLPPLMLTEDEIEALLIEARIVESWADPGWRSRPATRWRRSGRRCRTSCGSARSASSPPRRASRGRRSAST